MPWRDIAVPSWCECGECYQAPREDEYVCCRQRPCRSWGEFQQPFTEIKQEVLSQQETEESPSELRQRCYEKTSEYFYKMKWYPQLGCTEQRYTALPSCIVWMIRSHFKEENGMYTGFPPKREFEKEVDAHSAFKSDMEACQAIFDTCRAGVSMRNIYMYVSDSVELRTDTINRGIELLPRFGFVAAATAFEAFVHDAVKRRLEIVFHTTQVNENNKNSWKSEFEKWLKSRLKNSEVWLPKDHESETKFWEDLELKPKQETAVPESESQKGCQKQNEQTNKQTKQNHTLRKLEGRWEEVFEYLKNNANANANAMSKKAVGLVQVMVDNKKERVLKELKQPTMQYIQETFKKLDTEVQSPNIQTLSVMTEHIITHYARKCKYIWQIWLSGKKHDVTCTDTETLSKLSSLFYGIRCIFCHGSPQKTLFGALRIDRIPQERSDLNIDVEIDVLSCYQGNTAEERRMKLKKRCQDYLLYVANDAKENTSQMTMDHDLFLTARSFYAYVVEIVRNEANCIAFMYTSDHEKFWARTMINEVQKVVDAARNAARNSADREVCSSPTPQASASSEDTTEPQMQDDLSATGAEQHEITAEPSTGMTPDDSSK